MANAVVPQLKDKGKVTRGWLGVSIQEVTPELAQSFSIKEKQGALVAEVFKGSPAERAGIEQGDVIVEFDGKQIKESKDLPQAVAATPIGKSVSVKLSRSGKVISKDLKVGQMDEKTTEVAKAPTGKKDRNPVKDVRGLMDQIAKAKDKESILLLVQRGGNRLFAAVTPK